MNTQIKWRDEVLTELLPCYPDQIVKCLRCMCFFSQKYFSRHHCGESDVSMAMKLATIKIAQKADVFLTDEFKNHILNKLRGDDCGHLVRTDLRILEFGSILYDKKER